MASLCIFICTHLPQCALRFEVPLPNTIAIRAAWCHITSQEWLEGSGGGVGHGVLLQVDLMDCGGVWAGQLEDSEVDFILQHLQVAAVVVYRWRPETPLANIATEATADASKSNELSSTALLMTI